MTSIELTPTPRSASRICLSARRTAGRVNDGIRAITARAAAGDDAVAGDGAIAGGGAAAGGGAVPDPLPSGQTPTLGVRNRRNMLAFEPPPLPLEARVVVVGKGFKEPESVLDGAPPPSLSCGTSLSSDIDP